MKRDTALALLVRRECSVFAATREAARLLGCSHETVMRWPREGHLPQATADRVLGAVMRQRLMRRVAQQQRYGGQPSPIEVDAITLP